ncbi:glutathione S-transferase [Lipomyces chichibuensis]|uniref:glutathione S-transferase n=1 Tax=Lipomyces chichibuensis TaxID=1546026 RepID=UPI00334363AD
MLSSGSEPSGLVLHWLENSRSHRILWLLEEIEVPYTLKVYKRNRKTFLADPALKRVHPLGKSPVLTDGDKVIAESALIIEYLISKYGGSSGLVPKTTEDEEMVKYYLHYTEASLHPDMLLLFITNSVRHAPMPFFIRPFARKIADSMDSAFAAPDATKQLDYLESNLEQNGTGYFVGHGLTGADIILIFPLQLARSRAGLTKQAYPHLWKWLEDMQSRDAYVRADKKAAEHGSVGIKL